MMAAANPVLRIAWRDLLVDRARTGLIVALLAICAIWLTVTAGRPANGGIGALLLGVAVLVQMSALTLGDRDRLRVFGLLDVNGAGRRVQQMVALVQATVLGVAGALAGLLVGVVVRLGSSATPRGPSVSGVARVFALSLGASLMAAVISGGRGRRVPTGAALAGRRPSPKPRLWRLGISVVLVALGASIAGSTRTWTDMYLAVPMGGFLLAWGAIGMARFAVSRLAGLSHATGGVLSHAGKGSARQRYRTGPLVALMTVVIGFCMVGTVLGASFGERQHRRVVFHHRFVVPTIATAILPDNLVRVDRQTNNPLGSPPSYGPTGSTQSSADAQLANTLQRAVPAAEMTGLNSATRSGHPVYATMVHLDGGDENNVPRVVAIGDSHLLAAFGVRGHGADLAAGRAVALTPFAIDRHHITIHDSAGRARPITAVLGAHRSTRAWPAAVISERTAQSLGLVPIRVATLLRFPRPITAEERSRVIRVTARASMLTSSDVSGESENVDLLGLLGRAPAIGGEATGRSSYSSGGLFSSGDQGDLAAGPFITTEPDQLRTLIITGAVLAISVIIIALTLASLDRRREDELFALLGAPHGFRRRLGATQAAMLAIIASGIGTALGLAAPAYAFWLYNRSGRGALPPIPFVLPVEAALVLLLAVPVAAAGATWALTPAIGNVQTRWLDD